MPNLIIYGTNNLFSLNHIKKKPRIERQRAKLATWNKSHTLPQQRCTASESRNVAAKQPKRTSFDRGGKAMASETRVRKKYSFY